MWSHRKLLCKSAWQDLRSRHAGTALGAFWAFLSPLILIGIYSVVYLVIYQVRVPSMTPFQYVVYIFAGLVPYLMTAEAISLGVNSLAANKAILSNTVYPVDLVAGRIVLSSQSVMGSGIFVVCIASLAGGFLTWHALLLPLLWGLHMLCLVGLIWLISLLAALLPDLKNLVPPIMMILLIISPFAYTPEMVPEKLKLLIALNPMAYFVIAYQSILVLGKLPPWPISTAIVLLATLPFVLGGAIFFRVKKIISDHV